MREEDGIEDFMRFLVDNMHLIAFAMMRPLPEPHKFDASDGFDRFLAATLKPVEVSE